MAGARKRDGAAKKREPSKTTSEPYVESRATSSINLKSAWKKGYCSFDTHLIIKPAYLAYFWPLLLAMVCVEVWVCVSASQLRAGVYMLHCVYVGAQASVFSAVQLSFNSRTHTYSLNRGAAWGCVKYTTHKSGVKYRKQRIAGSSALICRSENRERVYVYQAVR